MRIKSRYINSNQNLLSHRKGFIFKSGNRLFTFKTWNKLSKTRCYYFTKNDSIPIEIKSPGEEVKISIKAVRQALENKIVILSRKSFPMQMETSSIIVGFEYPNDRSEVYRAIIDIKNTYQIKIGMLDFDTLIHLNIQKLLQKKIPDLKKLKKLIGKGTI